LLLVSKNRHGQVAQQAIEKVAFVELVGQYGWRPGRKDTD
jgi:hypothetical protein